MKSLILLLTLLLSTDAFAISPSAYDAQARYILRKHRHHKEQEPKPKVWRHGTINIAYPFTTGTSILDEWSKRQRAIAIGSCEDPIPALNLSAFEGE